MIFSRRGAGGEVMGLEAQLRRMTRLLSSLIAMAIVLAVIDSLVVLLFLQPQLDRQVQGALGLEQLNTGMLNGESGIRGYLVLRDGPYLSEYRDARALADAGAKQLSDAVGNDTGLSKSMLRLQVAQSAWYDEWAVPTIAVPPLPGDTRALEASINNDRALFGRYHTAETGLAGEIEAQISATNSTERTIHVVSATAAAIVWGILLAVGTRQRRRLGRAIVEPVDSILRTIRAVAQGDLGARTEPTGPVELRAIADGLGEMAEALAVEKGLRAAGEAEITAQSERFRQIITMARDVAGSLNLHYVVKAAAVSALAVTDFPRVVIWLLDEEQRMLIVAYDTDQSQDATAPARPIELGENTAGRAAKYGRLVTGSSATDALVGGLEGSGSVIAAVAAMPMIVGARVVGVIEVRAAEPRELNTAHLDSLEMLSTQAATAVEAARLHRDAEERSQTDALTRLYNRRRLDEDLARECAWSARAGHVLSFIMIDVDHFKRFNNTYGHQRADEVLQEIATVLGASIRTSDSVYRYGGEELAVLLRSTPNDDAMHLAERLRSRVEERFRSVGQPAVVTASFGVASMPIHALTPTELIAAADAALYVAKRSGRNRVMGAAPAAGRHLAGEEGAAGRKEV